MFRSRWLHDLFRLGHSRKDRRRHSARPRPGVRLMLEALEDRLTPSTVEYAPDAATLQADLNNATAANTQYVINLSGASSAYNLAYGQELTVSAAASGSSVSIVGSGQSITGNGNRVFYIDPGANVVLADLTITGGSGVSEGGGVYAAGSNWTVSLIGDILSNNTASAGEYGTAAGGAAYFSATGGSCRLTILNNLAAPIADPSIMIDNYVHAGADGHGGLAEGGALYIGGSSGANLTANIGNTAFYNNRITGGNGGASEGGGVYLGFGNVTMVNCTVADNHAAVDTGGTGGAASGGGIYDADSGAVTLDDNTIHANTLNSPFDNAGKGMFIASGNPTLINNLIRGNYVYTGSGAKDLETNGIILSNATNNSVGLNSANSLNAATNSITSQIELGDVRGVPGGQLSGGPIYYPLLNRAFGVGAGTTSVLNTIAAVEGTTAANAVDALGNLLSAKATLDIGAVQVVLPPPYHASYHAPYHAPYSPPSSSPIQALVNELDNLLSAIEVEIKVLLDMLLSDLKNL